MLMQKWFLILVTCYHSNVVDSYNNKKLRCNCNQVQCVEPEGCSAGKVRDACNCCNVCAKTEGERCGGRNHIHGECGHTLQCMVRRLRTYNNRKIHEVGALIGRCEHEMCHMVQCPFGKSCFYENGGTFCGCPKCIEMISEPVCGESNNKVYSNECELRKEECMTGRKIGLIRGTCLAPNVSRIVCDADSMKIEVLKSYVNLDARNLSLFDANCKPKENATHLIFHTKLNECGTKVFYTLTSVIYTNAIRTVADETSAIIRYRNIKVPFECDYLLQNKNVFRIMLLSNRSQDRSSESRINIRSVQKTNAVEVSNSEKYLVVLKSKVSKNANSTLRASYCYASSAAQPSKLAKYTLVKDGCPVDGVEIVDSNELFIKLLIPSITFRGIKSKEMLVKCKVRSCFFNDLKKDSLCNPRECK